MKKIQLRNIIIGGLFSTCVFSSCKNETELIDFKNVPTQAEFMALRQSALDDITNTITFNAEEGINYISPNAARLSILPNCLQTQNGQHVSGTVEMSFIEIYDRGTMALTNKPVMGKDINGNLLPLITGGQYNIRITKNEEELKPGCPINIRIPTSNTGGNDDEMIIWNGEVLENGNLVWEEDLNPIEGLIAEDTVFTYVYDVWASRFGWTNIDRFYNDTRPKTQIKVKVPQGYTNHNSAVYLSYEGERNLLAQLDTYDNTGKFFSEHYGFLPIDLNVHIIFITENDENVTYAIKKVKIAADAIIIFQDNELNTATKDALKTLVNNLQ